jgi:RIO kinase 1
LREYDRTGAGRRRRRFDDDELADTTSKTVRPGPRPGLSSLEDPEPPAIGDRWSTWDAPGVAHGPEPRPEWLVTDLAAVDDELGLLKTGKEADVHLIERRVPETGRSCLLAAKRYRGADHRMFHRDAQYTEGRRVRRSRETRAMAGRTAFGRDLLAGQWAAAEFAALGLLWRLGRDLGAVTVPYPVQLTGSELLLEFVDGPDGTAAPRLAQLRPAAGELAELWERLVESLAVLARAGFAHGDLSPYNILVRDGRPVLIDLPQIVDIVANPQGPQLLARDVSVVATWFVARGLPAHAADPARLTRFLLAEAGLRPE